MNAIMNNKTTAQEAGLALHDRVRAVLPKLAENVEKCYSDRRVPDENFALLREAGFYKAFQPAEYGGLEIRAQEYGPILMDIAKVCASTAWASGLLAQHQHGLALLSKQVQDEVWGEKPDTLLSSSVAPIITAEEVEGGIRLSGSFGWSSGCDHADWAFLGCKMSQEGFDEPMPHLVIVPKSDYEIVDDWHVAGLEGTGSKTLKLDNVFVPQHRCESHVGLALGISSGFGSNAGELFHASFFNHFGLGFSIVALATAQRFADVYRDKISNRVRAYTGTKVSENVPSCMRLAETVLELKALEATIKQDWAQIDDACSRREMPTAEEQEIWRANQTFVTNRSIDALDRLFRASGGSAFFNTNEMQRLWRDNKMTGAHAYSDLDVALQKLGAYLMEVEAPEGVF
ncbi:MAG: acyl-CoA dehydrogenase family protein [Pseudomonadota bacterium]|nr:acyl-CoA dehydrogenase family protein [Pseudomonadota bacterium]